VLFQRSPAWRERRFLTGRWVGAPGRTERKIMTYEKEIENVSKKIQYFVKRYMELMGMNDRRASYFSWDDKTRIFWGKTTKKNLDIVKSEAEKNST
jgi:hypothetical protein